MIMYNILAAEPRKVIYQEAMNSSNGYYKANLGRRASELGIEIESAPGPGTGWLVGKETLQRDRSQPPRCLLVRWTQVRFTAARPVVYTVAFRHIPAMSIAFSARRGNGGAKRERNTMSITPERNYNRPAVVSSYLPRYLDSLNSIETKHLQLSTEITRRHYMWHSAQL